MKLRCIRNPNESDLVVGSLYQHLPDANDCDMVRVVDESQEDYLYPAAWFVPAGEPIMTFQVRGVHYLPAGLGTTALVGTVLSGSVVPRMEVEVPTAKDIWVRRVWAVETFGSLIPEACAGTGEVVLALRGWPPRKDIRTPAIAVSHRI